jgi:NADH pyrophosphatase NudC (nudix superfamily)
MTSTLKPPERRMESPQFLGELKEPKYTKAEISKAMKSLFGGKKIEALDVAALSGPEVHPEIRAYAVMMWKRQQQNCPYCGRRMKN